MWKRPIILTLCAILVSLAGAEGFLRWRDVADPPAFDTNPHYGYLMRPNQSVSTRGHRFRINNAGLRGADFSVPKGNGVLRLVFLGDSITYGGGQIPDPDLFVNRVARTLASSQHRQIEAINLAAPGWGIQNMAGYLATKGHFDADALIWVISSSDFRRPKTSLEDNGFFEQKAWSRLTYAMVALSRYARPPLANSNHRPTAPDPVAQNLETFRRTLSQITRRDIACVVVVVPAAHMYAQSIDDVKAFRSVSESRSVPFMDVGPTLRQRRPEEMFLDGFHLTIPGHEVVANTIVPFLQQNILIRTHEPRGGGRT